LQEVAVPTAEKDQELVVAEGHGEVRLAVPVEVSDS